MASHLGGVFHLQKGPANRLGQRYLRSFVTESTRCGGPIRFFRSFELAVFLSRMFNFILRLRCQSNVAGCQDNHRLRDYLSPD
jgi:hypothetical protein